MVMEGGPQEASFPVWLMDKRGTGEGGESVWLSGGKQCLLGSHRSETQPPTPPPRPRIPPILPSVFPLHVSFLSGLGEGARPPQEPGPVSCLLSLDTRVLVPAAPAGSERAPGADGGDWPEACGCWDPGQLSPGDGVEHMLALNTLQSAAQPKHIILIK